MTDSINQLYNQLKELKLEKANIEQKIKDLQSSIELEIQKNSRQYKMFD